LLDLPECISKKHRPLWALVIYLNNLGAIQVGLREHPSTVQVLTVLLGGYLFK
jgi:hypothetical protein